MNTNHFPDITRCKKLTDIGFPKTELYRDRQWELTHSYSGSSSSNKCAFQTSDIVRYYSCPSVMEMLDVIPDQIEIKWKWKAFFSIDKLWHGYYACYTAYTKPESETFPWWPVNTWLPNGLVDLIIWLHENNYIKF